MFEIESNIREAVKIKQKATNDQFVNTPAGEFLYHSEFQKTQIRNQDYNNHGSRVNP